MRGVLSAFCVVLVAGLVAAKPRVLAPPPFNIMPPMILPAPVKPISMVGGALLRHRGTFTASIGPNFMPIITCELKYRDKTYSMPMVGGHIEYVENGRCVKCTSCTLKDAINVEFTCTESVCQG